MLKDRIQEIFEFTKSESPYRKANKGWINQDIFLDLSASSDTLKQKKEDARITFLWSPINSLLSNIFIILLIGSILVFTSLSLVKSRFDFNLFNKSEINDIAIVDENKGLSTHELDDLDLANAEDERNLNSIELDKPNEVNLSDDNEIDIKDIQSNKDIKNLKNNISKSNFI